MNPVDRFALGFLAVLAILVTAVAVPNGYTALQRSKQKDTMATVRDIATRIEEGKTVTSGEDGWGYPLRIHQAGRHYMIRAAAADGRFDSTPPRGGTTDFADDIVYGDGGFAQHPEGI